MPAIALRSAAGRVLRGEQLLPGRRPALNFVWLHGLASVAVSQKSDALVSLAARLGAGCLRVDMTGHGKSEGGRTDITLSAWLEDAAALVAHAAQPASLGDGIAEPTRVRLSRSVYAALRCLGHNHVGSNAAGWCCCRSCWSATRSAGSSPHIWQRPVDAAQLSPHWYCWLLVWAC